MLVETKSPLDTPPLPCWIPGAVLPPANKKARRETCPYPTATYHPVYTYSILDRIGGTTGT